MICISAKLSTKSKSHGKSYITHILFGIVLSLVKAALVSRVKGQLLWRNLNMYTTGLWRTESQTMRIQCESILFTIIPLLCLSYVTLDASIWTKGYGKISHISPYEQLKDNQLFPCKVYCWIWFKYSSNWFATIINTSTNSHYKKAPWVLGLCKLPSVS